MRASAVQRSNWGIAGLAGLLILGAALHFLGGNVADPDLWAHLQYGRTIWEGQGLPRVEAYSYTAPGAPFYDHEWLTDVLCAGIFSRLGAAGLVVGKLFLLGAMLLLLLDTVRRLRDLFCPNLEPHPLAVALAFVLGLAVIGPGATFRAQLFTMTFLALEADLLARADLRRRAGKPGAAGLGWEVWSLPPLLLLWANLHGGFLVGLGLLGLFAAAAAGEAVFARPVRQTRAARAKRVAGLAAVCVLAALAPLVNPYGWYLYAYLAATLGMHGQISEWYPVEVLSDHFLRFKLLGAAGFVAFAVLWPGRRGEGAPRQALPPLAWRAAFLLLAVYMALRHQRHTVLFAIAATPLVAVAAEPLRRRAIARFPFLRPRRPVFTALAVGAAGVALFQIATWSRQIAEHGGAIRYGRLDYPVDAVEFLKKHGFAGNVAMPLEWGAYAITKMAPEAKVFIDGRFEAVYPPRVIDDYFAFLRGTPGWERLLDAYPTDVVVVQRWRDIHPRLFARDDLVYVYSDPAALVFARRGPRNQAAMARLAAAKDRNDFPRLAAYFP